MTLRMFSDQLPAGVPACYFEDKKNENAVIVVSRSFDGDATMLAAIVDSLLDAAGGAR